MGAVSCGHHLPAVCGRRVARVIHCLGQCFAPSRDTSTWRKCCVLDGEGGSARHLACVRLFVESVGLAVRSHLNLRACPSNRVRRLKKQPGTGKSIFKSGYQRRFVRMTATEVPSAAIVLPRRCTDKPPSPSTVGCPRCTPTRLFAAAAQLHRCDCTLRTFSRPRSTHPPHLVWLPPGRRSTTMQLSPEMPTAWCALAACGLDALAQSRCRLHVCSRVRVVGVARRRELARPRAPSPSPTRRQPACRRASTRLCSACRKHRALGCTPSRPKRKRWVA